jgi:adenosylcobinamide hydrolase
MAEKDIAPEIGSGRVGRGEGGDDLPVLIWRWPAPMRCIATSPFGGGIGSRCWVINAQVPHSYSRLDPDDHVGELATSLGLVGSGVGMLTAADVRAYRAAQDNGAQVAATVGLTRTTLAAAPEEANDPVAVGTINIVAVLPARLSDAALVNCVATVTEAKVQALRDAGFDATGTATDAVCVLCPEDGPAAAFGGPRSPWGSRLARGVYSAILAGAQSGSALRPGT